MDWSALSGSLAQIASFLWWLPLGVAAGLIIGALPGFSSSNALVVMLPVLLTIDPVAAMVFMAAVYCGAEMGGSVPAILLNVPGTPGALVTCFDGYEMGKQGRAQEALAISAMASGVGGIITTIVTLAALPFLGRIALSFGTVPSFVLILFGIGLIGQLTGRDRVKGLLVGLLALLVGATGFDHIYDVPRATFGFIELYDGIPVVPALVGLFGITEALFMLEHERTASPGERLSFRGYAGTIEGIKVTLRSWVNLIRSSIVGLLVGVIPGAGGNIAALVAYQQAMTFEPSRRYGKGDPNGVLAAEAANNGVISGALIPLFTLGLPGSGTAIVMLIVMQAHGMLVGTRLYDTRPDVAYTVIGSMVLGNVLLALFSFVLAPFLARIAIAPTRYLAPVIIVLSLTGAYAPRGLTFDMAVAVVFGFLGYVMRRAEYPVAPMILGIVLGPFAEEYFLRGLRLGGGNVSIFFRDPLSVTLWVLLLLTFAGPVVYRRIRRRGTLVRGGVGS